MGPRLLQRGNPLKAEKPFHAPFMLQWGRACYSAEILYVVIHRVSDGAASMGPRLLQRGNHRLPGRTRVGRSCFNGAAPVTARKSITGVGPGAGWVASMGPRLLQRGNLAPSVLRCALFPLQWGRACYSAEIDGQVRG